jgi:D-3-phosphoglycerate dehydrogenase
MVAVENLLLDLLERVGSRERTYQETMEAWRTSCPRLPPWENFQVLFCRLLKK